MTSEPTVIPITKVRYWREFSGLRGWEYHKDALASLGERAAMHWRVETATLRLGVALLAAGVAAARQCGVQQTVVASWRQLDDEPWPLLWFRGAGGLVVTRLAIPPRVPHARSALGLKLSVAAGIAPSIVLLKLSDMGSTVLSVDGPDLPDH